MKINKNDKENKMKEQNIEKRFQTVRNARHGSHNSFLGKALWGLAAFLAVAATATDANLSATYWTTTFSDPTSTLINNQAIFGGSQPTVIMKFDRVISSNSITLLGSYTETAAPYKLKPRGDASYWSTGAGTYFDTNNWTSDTWLLNGYQVQSSDTTFNSADNAAVNQNWRDNAVRFTVLLNEKNVDLDPSLIKSVQLWKSRVRSEFSHREIISTGSNYDEAYGIVLVQEIENTTGDMTAYTFDIETDVRETTHYKPIKSNTTHFFVTIKTADDVSGKNKWAEGSEGGSAASAAGATESTRKCLDFGWRRGAYASNSYTTNGYTEATPDYFNFTNSVLTIESCVYDILPYEDYTSNYSGSAMDELFGIKLGPGNQGYPPSSPQEFTNVQIKFITVNGINYFEETGAEFSDFQSMNWATGLPQRTLMPLNEPFAVLGINLAGTTGDENSSINTEYINEIDVQINVPSNSSFDPRRDLSNSILTEDGHQNITVWKDVNNNGFFDEADKRSGQVAISYDPMSGEISNTAWSKSTNTYTATLLFAPQNNGRLEKTQNGISKFFVCVCSNPSSQGVTTQPYYGSDFTMKITSIKCYRQAGFDTVNAPDGSFPPFVSTWGYTLGEGYANLANVNKNFNDVTSRPVTIGLAVSKYVDDIRNASLDSVLPDPLEADGMPVPVLAINMAGSPSANVNEKLHSVKVRFSTSGFNPDKHIAPLTGDALSGVSIWKDNKDTNTSNNIGVFDPRVGIKPSAPFANLSNTDTVVELSPDCLKWYFHNAADGKDYEWDGTQSISATGDYFYVLLKFKKALELYDNDDYYDKSYTGYTSDALGHSGDRTLGKWRGWDYFICIRGAGEGRDYMTAANRGLDYNDTFGISIVPSQDLLFGYGENAVDASKLSTAITTNVKATMPVFFIEPNTTGFYDINGKTALLGFSVVAPNNNYSFDHFAFQVIDQNNTFALSDFVDLADNGDTCGISLWRDNGDGRFDEKTDQRIKTRTVDGNDLPKISTMTWLDGKIHMIELNLDRTSVGRLPTTDEGRRADFFLVFQPTKNVTIGDALTLQIFGSDLLGTRDDTISFVNYSTGARLPNPDGSQRTTPGTYKRFRSKTYVAAEAPENVDAIDTDNDGIPDWFEYTYFGNLTTAGPGNVDGYTDYDNDGLNDYYEFLSKTSPLEKDTDHNGTPDGEEDFDHDDLTNKEEQHWRTDPWVADYDDDGINDGPEVNGGTSPKHSMSPGYQAALNASAISADGIVVPFTKDENIAGMPVWTVQVMFNSSNQPLTGVLFRKVLSNNALSFEVGLNDNTLYVTADFYGGIDRETVSYPVPVPVDDKWHQVSVTWDGGASSMRLVVDGISQHVKECKYAPVNDWSEIVDDTQSANGPGASTDVVNKVHREFTFTMLMPGLSDGWGTDVLFDEIRIWNRTLTTAFICDTMNSLVGKDNTGLMRCYRFDDGGTTIEDFAHPGPAAFKIDDEEAIEKLTYPGTPRFTGYALREGFTAAWCSANNGVHLYGFDDEDGDGMPDWYEFFHNVNSPYSDADNDGLVNLYEYLCGTDPNDKTSGSADYDAVCAAGDMTNGEKQLYGLDPRLADSDGDGVSDYDEISGGVATVYSNNVRDGKSITDPLAPLSNEQPPVLKHIKLTGDELGLHINANEISKYALSDWTLGAWVRPETAGQNARIITRSVSAQAINYELGIRAGVPYAKFVDANGRTLQVPEDTTLTPALTLAVDEWTHIAATYESRTRNMTLYINGMAVAQVTGRPNMECPAYGDGVVAGTFVGANMRIGAGFTGLLDNINIYANALTANEIAATFRLPNSATAGKANPYYTEQSDAAEAAVFAANMSASVESLLAPEHAADRLIIKFSEDVSESMIQAASRQYGIKVLRKYETTGAYLIQVPKTLDLAKGIEALRKYNAVKYIQPDYIETLNAKPNDPSYSQLWGLKNSGQNGGTPGMDIGVEEIWDTTTGSNDIIVAVIDTGIDYNHPDLKANLWTNKGEIAGNGKDDDGNGIIDDYYGMCAKGAGTITGDPMDDDEHGTHCAGTIGAVGNNGVGVVGVNWKVKLMALKALHPVPGQNASGSQADIITCIEYAIKHKANVISMSLGGTGYNAAYYDMLNRARAAGILVVAAAGNENSNNDDIPQYPSDYSLDNIISVAAMDNNGKPASFTNWSATSVDVAAPGVNIYSTLPGGGYGNMSGTSMATPHVSGLAALLMSAYPSANYALIRDAILNGSVKVVGWEQKPIATMARVSLTGAVEYLNQNVGGLVASFRGNGVNAAGNYVFDLTESEFGAGVPGLDGGVPDVRKAATGTFSTVNADSFAEFGGDSDGDGMPDWYEVAVGHDPNKADGEDDEDKDRLTNYFEYLAGTSPWMQRTDRTHVDRELTVDFTTDINYKKAQEMKFHPLAETTGYEGYDTDDDGISDVDEIGYGAATETSLPADSLSPYVDRVLKITAADSYLEIPNTIDYALTENWTIDLWFKIDPTLAGDAILVRRFIDTDLNDTITDTNYEIGLEKQGEEWCPYVRFESEDGERKLYASVTVPADKLTHVGASYDSNKNEMILVIDNNSVTTVDCMGYTLPNVMGISHVRVGEGFLGEIDAVRIWNTATDTFSNYKGAAQDAMAGTVPDGLVGSFTFDDGGVTAQNFAVAKDDWKVEWVNAAELVGTGIAMVPATTAAPEPSDEEQEDSDNDGLPDYWERQYFGDLSQGPNDDPDDDKLNNLYEYWSHTNPTIPQTDGAIDDGNADYDHDGVANLDEQYFGTRPDMVDTDDDGLSDGIELGFNPSEPNYGFEVSSPTNSLEQPSLDETGHVALDDNGNVKGLADQEEIERVFRMDGTNNMTVADNAGHSGKNLSFAFVLTPNIANDGKTAFVNGTLPGNDTVFMRRSVKVGESELLNYRFTVSSNAIKFQFAQNATVPRFVTVAYTPDEGIQAGVSYYVSAVANLTAATPTITLKVATKNAGSDTYTNVTNSTNFSTANAATISGTEGTLTLGFDGGADNTLVLDVDNLTIWNFARAINQIDPTVENFDPTASALGNGQLVSFFRFDDGGVTAEDFGYEQDWMTSWKHAGVLSVPSVQPIENTTIGKGMIKVNGGAIAADETYDADDDGIPDSQELIGNIENGRRVTDSNNPYDPLINRVLDLTGDNAMLVVENFRGNNMRTDGSSIYDNNGFTIELWYKLDPTNTTSTAPLVQKTNADPTSTAPGDFWFGLVDGYLTVMYRVIGGNAKVVRFTAKKFDNPDMGWIHASVSVHLDPANADAMLVNFIVYAEGMEYSSETMQKLGVNNAYPNNYSGKLDPESLPGSLQIGGYMPNPPDVILDPQYIKMTVDEVRIWKGARTDTQISANRNRILTDNDAGTVALGLDNWTSLAAYFRFDDGGTKAYYYTKAKSDANKEWTTGGTMVGSAHFTEWPSEGEYAPTYDYLYADTDNDKIPDFWEYMYFGNLTTAGYGDVDHYTDTDGDGLNDLYEYITWCNPLEQDTYDTGIKDSEWGDIDGDDLTLLQEQKYGTDPFDVDTDDDGVDDNVEVVQWGTENHGQVTNPNFSIAHYGNGTTTPNWALDLAQATSFDFNGFNPPLTDRFVSLNGSYAVEAWFKSAAAEGSDATETGVIAQLIKPESTIDGTPSAELLVLGINAGVPYARVNGVEITVDEALKGSTWAHLAAVFNYNDGTVAIYINGIEAAKATVADNDNDKPKTDYNTGIEVTVAGDGTSCMASGLLDEIRIFNTYRTEECIRKQMKLASDQHTIGLVAYYRFDDCGGTIEDYMHPFPGELGDNPLDYALDDDSAPTEDLLSESDIADPEGVGLLNEPEGTVPNWWAYMYKTPHELGLSVFKGHAYQLVTPKKTYAAATAEAKSLGGTLAIISSQSENDFIANNLLKAQKGALIGLDDINAEGQFVWADGTPLAASSYIHWSTKAVGSGEEEPNNSGNEDFGMLVGAGHTNQGLVVGFWNDVYDNRADCDSYVIEYSNYLSYNNLQDADWDYDGISAYYEYKMGLNPLAEETVAGQKDAKRDYDLDGLNNRDELQTYGTDPLEKDTDDDGRSDGFEVVKGTNPLVAQWTTDFMAQIPAAETITYKVDDLTGETGFSVAFDAMLDLTDAAYTQDIVSRGNQFKVYQEGNQIVFAASTKNSEWGATLTSDAIESADTYTHVYVAAEAKLVSNECVLTLRVIVYDADGNPVADRTYKGSQIAWANGNDDKFAGGYKEVIDPVIVGTTASTKPFVIDNLAVTVDGTAAISSNFNDLGKTFENAARTILFGKNKRQIADVRYAGIPSKKAYRGDLEDETKIALRHRWLNFNTYVEDSDNDGIKDKWEINTFGDLDTANARTDNDEDGLLDLYESLIGNGQGWDPNDDADGDGLSNIDEQTAGTHPMNPDTDDDGLSDLVELQYGRNPLDSRENTTNYAVKIPAGGTVTYPAAKFNGHGSFTFSFDAMASDDAQSIVLLTRDGQFKVELVNGVVTVSALDADGNVQGTTATAGEAVAKDAWFTVEVTASAANGHGTLKLTVTQQGAEWSPATTTIHDIVDIEASVAAIVLGDAASTTDVTIDNLKVNIGGQDVIESDFNDLGTTFENRKAPTLIFNGKGHIDQAYAGVAVLGGANVEDTQNFTVVLDGEATTIAGHAWLVFAGDSDDTDNDGISDKWELDNFGNLTTAGPGTVYGYTDSDNDGLNDLYESLIGDDQAATPEGDADNDGLSNRHEQEAGTNPKSEDTDDDGRSDLFELQHSTDPDQLPVPLWASKNSLYADFPLFHGTLRAQLGVDLRYHTAYHAPFYDPATGLFLQQDALTVGNYLWGDLFVTMQVKRASIYIKAGHLNALWENPATYFLLPHYPGQKFGLQWGLTWCFFD